jgi:hypothetical protein
LSKYELATATAYHISIWVKALIRMIRLQLYYYVVYFLYMQAVRLL